MIPFDNTISKDSELYQLYNTNIHEKIALGLSNEVEDEDTYRIDPDVLSSYFDDASSESDVTASDVRDILGKNDRASGSTQTNSWLIY